MPKGKKKGNGFIWTADEDAALVEAVDEYGLDFDRIKAEAGARLGDSKVNALYDHFRYAHPDKYEELKDANPSKQGLGFV